MRPQTLTKLRLLRTNSPKMNNYTFKEHLSVLSKRELYHLLAWINACIRGDIVTYGISIIDKFEDDRDLVESEINNRIYKKARNPT